MTGRDLSTLATAAIMCALSIAIILLLLAECAP